MLANETNKQILIVDRDVASVEPLRHKLTDTRLLRGTEYRLLEFLMTHPGRTFNPHPAAGPGLGRLLEPPANCDLMHNFGLYATFAA
jgi:hypothetical protein